MGLGVAGQEAVVGILPVGQQLAQGAGLGERVRSVGVPQDSGQQEYGVRAGDAEPGGVSVVRPPVTTTRVTPV